MPSQILEQQIKNITKVLDHHKLQVKANFIQSLELNTKSCVDLIEEMKNPELKSIQDSFKNTMAIIEERKPKLGFDMCMDISSELNQLIGMIEKGKIISDPDIIQLKSIIGQVLEVRKKVAQQQAEAISSPALTAQIEQKAGEKNG